MWVLTSVFSKTASPVVSTTTPVRPKTDCHRTCCCRYTFDRNITTNVGNVDSQGVEFSLNATPIQTKDWNWDLSFNMTWQKMKVKNLSLTAGTPATNTSVGPYIDSYQVQTLSEGYAPYMFYVYHQLYDEKPANR